VTSSGTEPLPTSLVLVFDGRCKYEEGYELLAGWSETKYRPGPMTDGVWIDARAKRPRSLLLGSRSPFSPSQKRLEQPC
jgi:hypothetical protein